MVSPVGRPAEPASGQLPPEPLPRGADPDSRHVSNVCGPYACAFLPELALLP